MHIAVLVPAANPGCREAIDALAAGAGFKADALTVLDGRAREAMVASDVVLLASGTATLEALLAKRPMVVGYKVARGTQVLVRATGLLRTDRYSLPNVLAGERLVPELIQEDCTPEQLAAAVMGWLRDPDAVAALEPRFRDIHMDLRRDASARAADVVEALVARR